MWSINTTEFSLLVLEQQWGIGEVPSTVSASVLCLTHSDVSGMVNEVFVCSIYYACKEFLREELFYLLQIICLFDSFVNLIDDTLRGFHCFIHLHWLLLYFFVFFFSNLCRLLYFFFVQADLRLRNNFYFFCVRLLYFLALFGWIFIRLYKVFLLDFYSSQLTLFHF